jgi:hypothetical protein
VALVADEDDLGTDADEPSPEDFAAAEHEEEQAGQPVVRFRILKLIGVLFVVLALLFYFAVPVSLIVTHISSGWRRPGTGIQKIPAAPEPTRSPTTAV